MIAGFIQRNPGYSLRQIRQLPAVRRAMKSHREEHPECAWCGREGSIQVHHIESVSRAPERAADPSNLVGLCGGGVRPGRKCHLIVGHFGSWKDLNTALPQILNTKQLFAASAESGRASSPGSDFDEAGAASIILGESNAADS